MCEDLVLTSSVLSKLHHVRLGEGERCSVCWKRTRMSREDVVDCVRMFQFPQREFHPEDWDRPRALAESIIASNSECLVNYFPVRTGDHSPQMTESDYNQDIELDVVVNQRNMAEIYINRLASNYRALRLYQATLRVFLLPEDPRLRYLDMLGPVCAARERRPQALQEELVATEAAARHRLRQEVKHSRVLGSIRILSHKDE
jgi:hypothetical protein